ncbi:zf-HC2 domain-containing protein [Catenuloplanes sp. NPDC051500]|uniref:zf-HC2 domain-containing protein n=1 Tax=Catenuloplanes sp. NPDC051500 TaxID=3363959 RepID=UPI0037B1BC77
MNASHCGDGTMRSLVGFLVLGRLSEAERAAVLLHLESCESCRTERDEIQRVVSVLGLLSVADVHELIAEFGVEAGGTAAEDQLFGAPGDSRPVLPASLLPVSAIPVSAMPVSAMPVSAMPISAVPTSPAEPDSQVVVGRAPIGTPPPRALPAPQPATPPVPVPSPPTASQAMVARPAGNAPAEVGELRPVARIGPAPTVDRQKLRMAEGYLPPRPTTGPLARGPHSHRKALSRRRRTAAAVGLTGVVVVALGVTLLLAPWGGAEGTPLVAVASMDDDVSGISMSALLYEDDSTVSVRLTADGLAPGTAYELYAVKNNGEDMLLGRLTGDPGGGTFAGDIALPVDDLWYFSVREVDGGLSVSANVVKGSTLPGSGSATP